MVSLDAFNHAWLIGLAFFGLHLVLLGALVLRGRISRALGFALIVAGAAYVVDTSANVLLPHYEDLETVFLLVVAIPSIVAELAFALWLLFRGGTDTIAPGPSSLGCRG